MILRSAGMFGSVPEMIEAWSRLLQGGLAIDAEWLWQVVTRYQQATGRQAVFFTRSAYSVADVVQKMAHAERQKVIYGLGLCEELDGLDFAKAEVMMCWWPKETALLAVAHTKQFRRLLDGLKQVRRSGKPTRKPMFGVGRV
eukprot:TRINITY_DN1061_c0_g1_i1.p1 TRINITY_DN1061_c0_g1~~TRINITY_DN1061_c0_g1_i1.p1  ORF type:complete len:142 (-),score=14.32 TRINITY_DN1061_c0_g1_i1:172-597(-)